MTTHRPKPQIGQTCEVYGQRCRIIEVEDYGSFGNIIVETLDGEHYYRLSGLSWTQEEATETRQQGRRRK